MARACDASTDSRLYHHGVTVEDPIKKHSDRRTGESPARSQASTVRAGGDETHSTGQDGVGGERDAPASTEQNREKGIDLNRAVEATSRRIADFNDKATASGEAVGRAVRDTLFRRQRRSAALKMAGVEFPDLLEAEACPGLVKPEAVLIPPTALRNESSANPGDGSGQTGEESGSSGDTDANTTDAAGRGDILPPPTARPPSTARRVASGVVLVAIAVGIGLLLSIVLVAAVAWVSSAVLDYFQN